MKFRSEGKIDTNGIISSNETITEKEGYDAMLLYVKGILGNHWIK